MVSKKTNPATPSTSMTTTKADKAMQRRMGIDAEMRRLPDEGTILALDTGTIKGGWAVIDLCTGRYLETGQHPSRTGDSGSDWARRIGEPIDTIEQVVERYRPILIAVEEPAAPNIRNKQGQLILSNTYKMGYAVGAAMALAHRRGLPLLLLRPQKGKAAAGNASAGKSEMMSRAAALVGHAVKEDEADAIWLAVAARGAVLKAKGG